MKIVFASEPFAQRSEEIKEMLGQNFETIFLSGENRTRLEEYVEDAEVIVSATVTKETLARTKKLRMIHAPGAGIDKIDRKALPPNINTSNTYGHGSAIAEYVVMMILALSRQLLQLDAGMRHGEWISGTIDPRYRPADGLRGKTLAVLGMGTIGLALIDIAQTFYMRVMGIRRNLEKNREIAHQIDFLGDMNDLEHVLSVADYLVVALPFNDETKGLLGRQELKRMKSSAFLINVARAQIVDEEALYLALKDGQIAGAALDVWYAYPSPSGTKQFPANYPFWELPNVIMTPHIAGTTDETFDHRINDVVENIKRLAEGKPLLNVVHPC